MGIEGPTTTSWTISGIAGIGQLGVERDAGRSSEGSYKLEESPSVVSFSSQGCYVCRTSTHCRLNRFLFLGTWGREEGLEAGEGALASTNMSTIIDPKLIQHPQ